MKNVFGDNLTITLFGESHGEAIGAVIDGLSPGMQVDENEINRMLELRRPSGDISTARREKDEYKIVSGVFDGKTTGSPVCIIIPNKEQKSRDYLETRFLARPGHADYTAYCKYHGFEDYRGGGHFSGRITAAIVAAGALVMPALYEKGIKIGTHLSECAGVSDRAFEDYEKDIDLLRTKTFPVLSENAEERMKEKILLAKNDGDSVGGILSTVITGLPAGLGEPYFDSLESKLSHAMFSIGGVKGIEFGAGFGFAKMRGSTANDSMHIENDRVVTDTNNNAGLLGGITNGMPVLFNLVIKPTPSIFGKQATVDFSENKNAELEISGRHDPCIAHRARIVVDAMCALVLADTLIGRYGSNYFTPDTK